MVAGFTLIFSLNHMQLNTGWCERSEADQLGNPLVSGQACFQRTCKQVNP
jgi:hypothetical protein